MDASSSVFASSYPYIRSLLVLLIGISGCFVFGMIGSMTYPGLGAIAGAFIGFAVFSIVGCLVVGKWKDFAPDGVDAGSMMPGMVAGAVYGHPPFTLYVTVHKAVQVNTNAGILGLLGVRNDSFVTVECGHNPMKATCVRRDDMWNETFKLCVQPRDQAVTFTLKDQDVIGDDVIGCVSVDIEADVIARGFPVQEAFKLQSGGKDKKGKAQLILTFDYGDDYSISRSMAIRENYEKRQSRHLQSAQQWKDQYGTFDAGGASSLASLHYNTDPQLNMDLAYHAQQAGTGSATNLQAV